MKICEIFTSIQGESTLQGVAAVFVRLAGCNLACSYCDTEYARSGGEEMSLEEIIGRVGEMKPRYVCITGGEPLLQRDTPELSERLASLGYLVSVETNGTLDASVLPDDVLRVIDVKCPGSGEHGRFCTANITGKRKTDEFKFVLTDRRDFEFAREFTEKHDLSGIRAILLSPAAGKLEPALLAEWIIDEMPLARLQLQLHKFIWPDEARGR